MTKLVVLHGPPAAGKLTVALELEPLTGFQVFHNHLTVDLVLSLFPFGSEPFIKLREEIWLSTFRVAANSEASLIFTFAPEKTVSPDFIEKAREVVESSGGEIVFVELTCSEETIESRLELPSRAKFEKLSSREQYRQLKQEGAFRYPPIESQLTLDTNETPPAKTAQLIAEYLMRSGE